MSKGPHQSTYRFIQDTILAMGDFDEDVAVLVRRLIDQSRLYFYRPGEYLIHQEDEDHQVYFVNHGVFKAILSDDDGNQTLLSLTFRGGLIGEIAALDDRMRSATVTAAMDASALKLGGFKTISNVLGRDNTYRLLSRAVCQRMRELTQLHEIVVTHSAQEAISAIIRRIIAKSRSNVDGCRELTIPLSQRDLSLMTGYRRETVNRVVNDVFGNQVRFDRHGLQVTEEAV